VPSDVIAAEDGSDDRILASDGRSWTKRVPSDAIAAEDGSDDRAMASDGRSWVKRTNGPSRADVDRKIMKTNGQTWGKRKLSSEGQKREEVPRSNERESSSLCVC
jgi:hypothetical protein